MDNANNITSQLDMIQKQHSKLIEKLKKIQEKIGIMLSKQGGKNKEIQELIRSIDKIIKTSGLTDEEKKTFEPLNESFEAAKKIEDDDEKILKLDEVKKSYSDLIAKKMDKIKSEIDSIINNIEKSLDKYTDTKTKLEIETEFKNFKKIYAEKVAKVDINGLKKLKNDLQEMNISRFGKIKVYMKIKPTPPPGGDEIVTKDGAYIINNFFQINNDQTIEIKSDTKVDKFGPFSKVLFTTEPIKDGFKNTTKNKNLFDEMSGENSPLNINSLLGRSTILFGYGISGSGKSWTILGGKGDPGLIQLLIESLSTNGVSVKLFKIFEHHLNSHDFIKTDGSTPHFVEDKLNSEIRDFKVSDYESQKNLDGSPNPSLIDFTELEKQRKILGSIKKTPNNPSSSRTHLFIIYEIKKDGKTGYVTFIDSAGKEEPLEIAKQFYTGDIKDPSLPFGPKNENDYKHASFQRFNFGKTTEDKQKIYQPLLNLVKDIMREGFFINESLAHMIYYFTGENISEKLIFEKKEGTKSVVSEYKSYDKNNKLKVFYDPPKSRITKKIETLMESNDKDPIMITTIFEYLTNLCTVENQKKFKFVMLGNTRTEERYRDDIIKTLRLVDLLKST